MFSAFIAWLIAVWTASANAGTMGGPATTALSTLAANKDTMSLTLTTNLVVPAAARKQGTDYYVEIHSWDKVNATHSQAGALLCKIDGTNATSTCEVGVDFVAFLWEEGDAGRSFDNHIATGDPFSVWWGDSSWATVSSIDVFVTAPNSTSPEETGYVWMQRGLAHMQIDITPGFLNTSMDNSSDSGPPDYDQFTYSCDYFTVYSYNKNSSIPRIQLCPLLKKGGLPDETSCRVREDFTVELHCCNCWNGHGCDCDFTRAASDPFSVFWGPNTVNNSWKTDAANYSVSYPIDQGYINLTLIDKQLET